MLRKVPPSERPQSLREIAQRAGRTSPYVNKLARGGLLPGYEGAFSRQMGAEVPPELAMPFTTVVRHGASLRELGGMLRDDPDAVEEFATALLQLVEQQRQAASPNGKQGEAA